MIVSHFELIYKPQSPAAPQDTGPVDNLIQGYFLEVTNLSDQTIEYALTFKAISVSDPNRSLADNALIIVDRPNEDNQFGKLLGSINGSSFSPSTGRLVLEKDETALVAILPSAFGPIQYIDETPLLSPTFEVRGYVELTVPALSPPGPLSIFAETVPQSTTNVATLVTPQNRTTYFKADGSISDQTQASVPIATGSGLLSIVPNPSSRIFDLLFEPAMLVSGGGGGVLSNDDAARLSERDLLAGLLAKANPASLDIKAINQTLAEQGIGFAIERRSLKALEPAQ